MHSTQIIPPAEEVEDLPSRTRTNIHSPGYLGASPQDGTVVMRTELGHEYVFPSAFAWYQPFIEILRTMDQPDVLGIQECEEIRYDDEVAANIDLLIAASTSGPFQLKPAVVPGREAECKYIQEFLTWMLSRLETPIDELRRTFVDQGMTYGTAFAEMMFDVTTYKGRDVKVVRRIKTKKTRDIQLIVDNFRDLIGILPSRVPNIIPIGGFLPVDRSKPLVLPNAVPKEKFLRYVWRQIPDDPRGRAATLPVWKIFALKRQILGNTAEWYARFSVQSIWATASEEAVQENIMMPDGSTKVIKPTDVLIEQLARFRNASVAAFPAGTELHIENVSQGGEVFWRALEFLNKQIARGLTRQHLATAEGGSHSRAAAEVHQDSLGLVINEARNIQRHTFIQHLLKPLVVANFGPEAVDCTPILDLGEGDGFPLTAEQVALLAKAGFLAPSQYRAIDRLIGLPQREEGELPANVERAQPLSESEEDDDDEAGSSSSSRKPKKGSNSSGS